MSTKSLRQTAGDWWLINTVCLQRDQNEEANLLWLHKWWVFFLFSGDRLWLEKPTESSGGERGEEEGQRKVQRWLIQVQRKCHQPPLRQTYGLSKKQHTCADAHTWASLRWWGLEEPERLISHHGGKLKGCQLSRSPSSVSCCLQASAPCCAFWFQAEGIDHLWSKLRSWIKSNGLAHYQERGGKLTEVWKMQPERLQSECAPSMGAGLRVTSTVIYLHR